MVAVALFAAFAAFASQGAHAQTPPLSTPPLRVTMYGDSVMLGAKEELLARFTGQPVTVDAVEDRSLLGAIGLFRSAGAALGDVVVLDLGYNDASDPATFRGRIDDAMAALGGVRRVLWLNQHDWGPGRAGMNAELVAAEARYPTLQVLDWNAEVATHPDEVYADSIHLTPAGQTAMATLVRGAYDDWVTSLTPTTTAPAPSTATGAPAPGAAQRAAAATDDDGSGFARRDVGLAAGAVVLLLVIGTVVNVGRRGARRAGRGGRRGR